MRSMAWENVSKKLFDITHDAILFLDPHGIIIQANPSACFICGFESEDTILRQSLKFTDLFDHYDLNGTKQPVEQWPVSCALQHLSLL